MSRLAVRIGSVHLKNPVICVSGEHTMTASGIRAALAAGAGAVVAKSVNEAEAGKRQLDKTDYVLLDSAWNRLAWNFDPSADAQLFCRSGLFQGSFERWLDALVPLDREAAQQDSLIIYRAISESIAELDDYMQRCNSTASELIGRAADRLQTYAAQPDRLGLWRELAPAEGRVGDL